MAPAHGTANQFRRSRNRVHRLLADYAGERPLSQPRVFVSHRMADVPYAERIAWLASRKAGLEYWLDVHDPVLRLASAALPPGRPVYAITVAAIIEMALLNCTHVIAAHTPPPNTSWRPSQWIPYELARAKKAGSVISRQAAGWFHPQVHPPESRGEYEPRETARGPIHLAIPQTLVRHQPIYCCRIATPSTSWAPNSKCSGKAELRLSTSKPTESNSKPSGTHSFTHLSSKTAPSSCGNRTLALSTNHQTGG